MLLVAGATSEHLPEDITEISSQSLGDILIYGKKILRELARVAKNNDREVLKKVTFF